MARGRLASPGSSASGRHAPTVDGGCDLGVRPLDQIANWMPDAILPLVRLCRRDQWARRSQACPCRAPSGPQGSPTASGNRPWPSRRPDGPGDAPVRQSAMCGHGRPRIRCDGRRICAVLNLDPPKCRRRSTGSAFSAGGQRHRSEFRAVAANRAWSTRACGGCSGWERLGRGGPPRGDRLRSEAAVCAGDRSSPPIRRPMATVSAGGVGSVGTGW